MSLEIFLVHDLPPPPLCSNLSSIPGDHPHMLPLQLPEYASKKKKKNHSNKDFIHTLKSFQQYIYIYIYIFL